MLIVLIFGGIDRNCIYGLKFDGTQLFNAILDVYTEMYLMDLTLAVLKPTTILQT